MAELTGKVALVTGAASGIGRRFAEHLGRCGASVLVADLRNAVATAAELRSAGLRAEGIEGDVSSEADTRRMVATAAERLGGLDVLVNNAALFSTLTPGPFTAITADEWQRVMAVNTLGPFLMAKAAVPLMRERGGGSIINIASNTVHKGVPGMLHYVSSKGAVVAMTRALSRELGGDAITVNAVAPGFTLSDGVQGNPAYEASFRAAASDARAIKRDQHPADLVGAVAFLASEGARFITGQTLIVDGGNVFI